MRTCNVALQIGTSSRLPALTECLIEVATGPHADTLLPRIVEYAADPRDFIPEPEKHKAVVDHLNQFLAYDGLELQHQGSRMRLVAAGRSAPVVSHLVGRVEVFDFDTVQRDLHCALASAETDPEDAVTAACSTVRACVGQC